jgi:pSer/pThr/pTyr-binding forkhead associated (FHA) protein
MDGEIEVNISIKTCPVCKSENAATAVECQNCGALLNDFPTDLVAIPDIANAPVQNVESILDTSLIPEGGIGIYIPGAPKAYYLHVYKELIIGRPADATFDSVLDLSELGAYAMGVSRRHVKLQRTRTGFDVVDLGSRNGSWLNGERLTPNKSYSLASGAELRIGKMRLVIVYHPASKNGSKQ